MKYQAYIFLTFSFILLTINNLGSETSQVVAQQAREVGKIFSIKGKVWIKDDRDSKRKVARKYDPLFDGDLLELEPRATVSIKCNDGKIREVISEVTSFDGNWNWPARNCLRQVRMLANRSTPGIGGDPLANALNYGDKGFLVRRLQEDLRQLGFFPVNPTGTFGPTTRDAVVNFQRSNGLIPNGIADSQTLALVSQALITSNNANNGWNNNDCNAARGEICLGEHSQRVIALQQQLQQWGFLRANTDGYYGAATRDAVAQFQRNAGLNATGFVDYQTWLALGFNNSTLQDYSQGYNYHQKPNYVQPIYTGYLGYPIQLPNNLPPAIIFPPLPPPTTPPLNSSNP